MNAPVVAMNHPLSILCLLISFLVPVAGPAQEAPAQDPPLEVERESPSLRGHSFSGKWKTTFGPMTLVEKDGKVTGSYTYTNYVGRITGTVEGGKLTFTYSEPQAAGEGEFTLSENGESFSGKWRQRGHQAWSDWWGERTESVVANYSGLWKTGFGPVRMHQKGDRVEGVYHLQGKKCRLHGKIEDGKLEFEYQEPEVKGVGWSQISKDLRSFNGKWKPNGSSQWQDLKGMRILRQPDVEWLVVLEARWEGNLRQREYSFGEMLKAFFARTPHVQVRHRFFTDEKSLGQWCEELAYLEEPVTLLISSHGTEKGVVAGHQVIDPETLVEPLSMAGNLKLVHFASCCVMGGPAPGLIQARMKQRSAPPISGYGVVVDWAASAVIDFTYLDLILSRGVPPEHAAEQVRKLLPFSGKRAIRGTAFRPADFRIQLPPKFRRTVRPIQKVSMWGDLRKQPLIDLGEGLKIRLGLEATSAPARSGILVYCLLEGQAPIPAIGNSGDTLGPVDFTIRRLDAPEAEDVMENVEALQPTFQGNERLYARAAMIMEKGIYQVEVRKRGMAKAIASTRIRGTGEAYHPWAPLGWPEKRQPLELEKEGEEEGPEVVMHLSTRLKGLALPAMSGIFPIDWTGPNRKISDLRLLPTLVPARVDPGLKLAVEKAPGQGGNFLLTLTSDEEMIIARPDWHTLTRWWVNGQTVIPKPAGAQSDMNGRMILGKELGIHLEFTPADLGAKSGDKIALQVLYLPGGWNFIQPVEQLQKMMAEQENPPRMRLSNRVEFEAP